MAARMMGTSDGAPRPRWYYRPWWGAPDAFRSPWTVHDMILALASREPMKRRPGVGTRRPNQAGVPDEPAARVSAPRVRRHWPAPPSPSTLAAELAAEECTHDAEGRSENRPSR